MEILSVFHEILLLCERKKYSDIHLTTKHYPVVRNNSGEIEEIQRLELSDQVLEISPFSEADMDAILMHILSKENYLSFMGIQ